MPSLSDIFGPLLMVAAVVLAVREAWAYRHRGEDDWLVTPRRLRRRIIVSLVLLVIGVVVQLEAAGVIATAGRPGVLLAYVTGLGGLSICLVIFAIMDIHDTAMLAARRSMQDLEQAIADQDRQSRAPASPSKNPDDGTT